MDGLNREPGLIRACGGEGGDEPTELPKHDFTCTDPSELILFTPVFGTTTQPGAGAEAVLDASRRVIELRESRGGAIPRQRLGALRHGRGATGCAPTRDQAAQRHREADISADGAPLRGDRASSTVVRGSLSGGTTEITAYAEGFV